MLLIRSWSARMILMRTMGDSWSAMPEASVVEHHRNLGRAHYSAPLGDGGQPVWAGSDLHGRHRDGPGESGLEIKKRLCGGILSETTPRWGSGAVRIGRRGTPLLSTFFVGVR